MFEGFEHKRIATSGAEINLAVGGDGPPVLLLHGYPQTHVIWHKVAPRLAEEFTVVAPDLRGYGDSAKPRSDPAHLTYSKRATAQDQVEVMRELGFECFAVVGHDRGGRVGHRMALDHPKAVTRLVVLDIVPTHRLFKSVNQAIATGYYHWFFLIQPGGLPETLIGADPEYYLREKLRRWSADFSAFAPEAIAEYTRCFRDPAAVHASCEDYRAAASIDLVHDEADMNRVVVCPVLALWGREGLMHRHFDVLETWRERCADVRGRELPCGHFLPEEAPAETCAEVRAFLAQT
ncbi:MAG: alpha/beta hydrolase [Gammaproteobacteria bacterium]|nr:alpha/beta hydrolase [Gammaproteobacteria bacterium]NIR85359.1 alpha/beta hydrolase [Gammaproteobacteria bacterium]NIR88877.1 alpha/beta hydrolase [Gammaproteobacteria bacterium]NIU06485.1 alpha/beta hydrolase [Gammaproteobacteria bacterium]NIV53378.1 alpha/beta fold hydrolase [Gammaproteobacteria bacterium]